MGDFILNNAHSDLVNALLLALSPYGFVKKNNVALATCIHTGHLIQFGVAGEPDVELILKGSGRYCGFEVKTGNAVQRANQKRFEKMIESIGGIYIVARSVEQAIIDLSLKSS